LLGELPPAANNEAMKLLWTEFARLFSSPPDSDRAASSFNGAQDFSWSIVRTKGFVATVGLLFEINATILRSIVTSGCSGVIAAPVN